MREKQREGQRRAKRWNTSEMYNYTVRRRLPELQLTEYIGCHAPFSCGHMALSDHYLFVSYAIGVLAERLNERASISLTC